LSLLLLLLLLLQLLLLLLLLLLDTMSELAKIAMIFEEDGRSDESYSSETTTLPNSSDHNAQLQSNEDDNVISSTSTPVLPEQKLFSLDQLYSVSKGRRLKNGVKFLLHMCTNHFSSLSDHHQKLIKQVTSNGVQLDHINFPRGALDKKLLGLFGDYLVNHARINQDESKTELKYGTLVNYFSAVKTWFTQHHPTYSVEEYPDCFTRDWSQLRAGLLREAKKRCHRDKVPFGCKNF